MTSPTDKLRYRPHPDMNLAVRINTAMLALNLYRGDIKYLVDGERVSCNVTTLRYIGALLEDLLEYVNTRDATPLPDAEALVEKLESLKYPNAKAGSHLESGNSMIDACIAVTRIHTEQPAKVPMQSCEIPIVDFHDIVGRALDPGDHVMTAIRTLSALLPYLRPQPVSIKQLCAKMNLSLANNTYIKMLFDAAGVAYVD